MGFLKKKVSATTNEISDLSADADEMTKHKESKLKYKVPWYYAPAFLLFWLVLFTACILPVFFHLPKGLNIATEEEHSGEFIAERAERILFDFEIIGPKVVGSYANENLTVQLLHDEIAKIRRVMHHDLFDLEVDVQVVSGAYMHWTMINMYQGVQNFVVKFSSKDSASQSYLLINSHFDSKPGSPGTGDDGAMVVIMLEVLRVLATTRQTFKHPIVFLFNGAEENPLQASHGFITQHKWAKNCQALINLESAGSGNREILFQTGPNHPWLMKYYRKHTKYPFCSSLAEEIFQADLLPSDSDFRIFRDFGSVPGLDFAHSYNGYVYHTEFDKFDVIPRGTLQNTGDNLLALARAFANAYEMEDTSKYSKGHTVYYDFLNRFVIAYTETQGKILNTCIAIGTLILVGISLWRMAANSYLSIWKIVRVAMLIFVIHLAGFILAFGLPILMAVIYDSDNRSMTWFTNKWLVFGIYIFPTLIGLIAPTLFYLSFNRSEKLTNAFKLQIVLHSHALILALICIVITFVGIRTSYMLMISLFFYACSLLLNLITTIHGRGYFWSIFVILSQILPFLYFTYIFYALINTLMPMMGRYGSAANPDLYIAGLCALATILSMGFLMPLVNIFRRPKLILLSLGIVTFIFCMLSLTHIGFPYRAKTNVGRLHYLQVQRVFYEYDGSVSRNESGFLFDFQDRRKHRPLKSAVDDSDLVKMTEDCEKYMMCGMPLFNHRWFKARKYSYWLPSEEPVQLPGKPTLNLLKRVQNAANVSVRYEFELAGPSHMSIFVMPLEGVSVKEWSFINNMLEQPNKYQPPYQIFFSYGKDKSPLKFHLELLQPSGKFDEPLMELGISGHYVSFEHARDSADEEFKKSLPNYIHAMEWPSSYERYIF